MTRSRILLALLTVLALAAAACGGDDTTAEGDGDQAAAAQPLEGLVRLTPGACADAEVTTGSYFRMVQSGGTVAEGPFVANGDSPCGDTTWVPLEPGTDGGLRLGAYQPGPEPAFDENDNATAGSITAPAKFFAVDFATSTNEVDPQTEQAVPAPRVVVDDAGRVLGEDSTLAALAAAWNGQHFNQGAPKPGGELPGNTQPVSGSYDADTGQVVLEWASQIEGGPFDGFTGVWHLEGTLEPG